MSGFWICVATAIVCFTIGDGFDSWQRVRLAEIEARKQDG